MVRSLSYFVKISSGVDVENESNRILIVYKTILERINSIVVNHVLDQSDKRILQGEVL